MRLLRHTAIALLLALAASSCADAASERSDSLRGAFSDATVDDLVERLAGAGIAVVPEPGAEPEQAVDGAASPVRLLRWQARNLALELSAGAGAPAAVLDELTTSAEPGTPATSVVVAAWASGADTPAADLAREVLGEQDLARPEMLLFPTAVLLLFASDVATLFTTDDDAPEDAPEAETSTSEGAAVLNPADLHLIGISRPCSAAIGYIDDITSAIVRATTIPPPRVGDTRIGWLNDVLQIIADTTVDGLNFAIGTGISVFVAGTRILIKPVLDMIARIATTLAVVAEIVSTVRPWTVRVTPDDAKTRKGVGNEVVTDKVKATVDLGGLDEWPTFVADCARVAGTPLPSLKPFGARVTWEVEQYPADAGLVRIRDKDPALHDVGGQATATLVLETGQESAEQAKRGDEQLGIVGVRVRIRRSQIEDLTTSLRDLILAQFSGLPDIIESTVRGYAGPLLDGLLHQLTSFIDEHGQELVTVVYHDPPDDDDNKPTTPPVDVPDDEDLEGFCRLLERYLEEAGRVVNAAPDDLPAALDRVVALNHELADAAPRRLRAALNLLVARTDKFAETARTGNPNTAMLLTPEVRAANAQLLDFGTNVCHLDMWGLGADS